MAPDLKPLAEVATHRPHARLERSPKTDKLFFKAADGTDIPVHAPGARDTLKQKKTEQYPKIPKK